MKNNPEIKKKAIIELKNLINDLEKIGKEVFKPAGSKPGKYLTSEQVCVELNIDETTLNRLVKNGFIKPVNPNQFDKSDIKKIKGKMTR
ncbi:MAG TPA: helix-turn-helix domain-containing protein [Paludibacter sp.]